MQWLLRVVCIGYVVFLTLLLLSADPSRLIGVHGELSWLPRVLLPVAHAVSFWLLAVLALTSRWTVPRWGIVLILATYGGMTEIIQGFVPSRKPEWKDWMQDLVGIAAGAASCWAIATLVGMRTRSQRRRQHPTSDPTDDREILKTAVQGPVSDKEG